MFGWGKKAEQASMLEMMGVIDLQPFCATDEVCRPYLERPFTFGEFTYATDGHICVRVPKRAGIAEGEVIKQENVEKLFAGTFDRTFAPPPTFETISGTPDESEECSFCKGSGREKQCPACNGEGSCEDDENNDDRNCMECEGNASVAASSDEEGAEDCQDCEGQGTTTTDGVPARARFVSHDFNLAYIKLMHALPGLEAAFGPQQAADKGIIAVNDHVMAFRFDGGCGLLMPMVREAEPVAEAAE